MSILPFKFGRWLFGSIQRQLALAFGSVALLMMLGLVSLLLKQQQVFLTDYSVTRAQDLANSLAYSSSSWVLANDVVGLSEIVRGYSGTPNLERVFIVNLQGQVLASTQPNEVGLFVNDSLSVSLLTKPPVRQVLLADSDIIDVAAPIMVNKQSIGWVRIELNQQATQTNLHSALLMGLSFILMTTSVVLVISMLLAKGMTRHLRQLITVAQHCSNGDRSVRAAVQHYDEINELGVNLNLMLDTLTQSEQQLDRLNHVYAAWTESVAAIVRETDESMLLNRICEILAEKIAFRLVIIGFVNDDNDWVTIVASSDWQLPYQTDLKVSINTQRPESRGPLGRAIIEQRTQIFNDFQTNSDTVLWREAARAASIQAVASLPLTRNDKVIGGISVYSCETDYFSDDIVNLLNGLAADISFALDNFDYERQRQQAETELTLAASVFENSQEGIFITDADKVIVRVNRAFSALTDYQSDDVIGYPYYHQMPVFEKQDLYFYQGVWAQVEKEGYWQGEIINRRKHGEVYTEWLSISRVTDKNGQLTHYVGIFVDITERKLHAEYVQKLAFTDTLTNLPNRRFLIENLPKALHNSQHSQRYGALMFMDIDRFKILNDTRGHALGDELLIEVSKRLKQCVRDKQDTVARLGGDEFVVLLEDLAVDGDTAMRQAQRVGNNILQALNEPYFLHYLDAHAHLTTIEHHSSASIGMKLFQGRKINSDDLLKQADMAMYQAKQAGRNTLRVFDPEMQAKLNDRTTLEIDMRLAMQHNQFQLHYQLQVDKHGQAIGAEVLLRWQHPVRGYIPPAEFIPLAEESGLIESLGLWVLSESCHTLASWATQSDTQHLSLAVNVSAKQFALDDFVAQVKRLLDDTHINPQRLKLEITESIILTNVEQIIISMNALRAMGLSFSIDDFGTGYSSLSYLQRLPLSQLKIDQSFVRDLAIDNNDAVIIRTILALGHSLGINVIAEGVETEQQRDYLLNSGCHFFQGYLFGKPMSLPLFEHALLNRL